jgi:methyl-accepting chemotaxis protein
MTHFLRRFSQARRVMVGFGALSLTQLAGGVACGVLLEQHGAPAQAVGVWSVSAVVALTGLVCGFAVMRSIQAPVEDTAGAVGRIARGDLETKVESPGRDELSWLRSELNAMRKKLRNAIIEVRRSVDSVATASREIARGNMDLSTRTEHQALALEQTTAAMDRLREAVREHASRAGEASTQMNEAQAVASRGGSIMTEVVRQMDDIHQSASRIGEIIGVIDGIAFQTNILALNAAVEAARAGEQGRGFAVVAAEVRTLAQRSAEAAKEIKTLIADSTGKVGAGTRLVGQAGGTMTELLGRVHNATELVASMARAGTDQQRGIEQAHEAIARIDEVTRQNAALVEQVAAAAQSLQDQSGSLTSTVSVFTVNP